MSHLSVCRTKIVNPNPQLVSQVIQALAQQYNAQILMNTTYRDKYVDVQADYILVVNGRAIGVRINRGKLEILGDPYGWREEFEKLKQEIIHTYVHFALIQQLQKMGYQITNVQKLDNGVIFGEVMKA